MRNRNNYNPYTQNYIAPVNEANMVYEPTYDPSEADKWANLLQQRQQRYDAGRQQLSQAEAQFGGMETQAPDILQQRVNDFTTNVEDMVSKHYNGDYGLAVNDIYKQIAKERSNPFYKYIAEQNNQAKMLQEAKLRNPDSFYTYNNNTLSPQEQLLKAQQTGDVSVFQQNFGYKPDTYALAEKQLSNVRANSFDNLVSDWTDSEKAGLAKAGIINVDKLLKGYKSAGISQSRLDSLKESMAQSMLNQTPYFEHMYSNEQVQVGEDKQGNPIMKPRALVEAEKVIEQASPQFVFNQVDKNIQNLNGKSGSGGKTPFSLQRSVSGDPIIDKSTQSSINGLIDNITKYNIDLDNPQFKDSKIADLFKAHAGYRTSESETMGNISDKIPVLNSIFEAMNVKMPESVSNLISEVEPTGVLHAAQLYKNLTGLYSKASSLESKLALGLAKQLTGESTVADAKDFVKTFETKYGINLDGMSTKDKFAIATQASLGETAVQGQLIPLGETSTEGYYNTQRLNKNLDSGTINFDIYVKEDNGNMKQVPFEKIHKELSLPSDFKFSDFKASTFNPSTGRLRANYYDYKDKKFKSIEFTDQTIKNQMRPIERLNQQMNSRKDQNSPAKGFGITDYSYEGGNGKLISAYDFTQDQNGAVKLIKRTSFVPSDVQTPKTRKEALELIHKYNFDNNGNLLPNANIGELEDYSVALMNQIN